MAVDWSDNIILAQLADEPGLSDELSGLIERLDSRKDGQDTPHVVLDFADVSYVNSSNIAQLLRLSHQLDAAGRHLVLCAMGDEVWSVMMVTGLEKYFRTAPDRLTALAGLQLDDGHDAAHDEKPGGAG